MSLIKLNKLFAVNQGNKIKEKDEKIIFSDITFERKYLYYLWQQVDLCNYCKYQVDFQDQLLEAWRKELLLDQQHVSRQPPWEVFQGLQDVLGQAWTIC